MNEKVKNKEGDKVEKKNYTRRLPNVELFQSISKDGRYQIIKRVETFVVPIGYIQKVMGETKSVNKKDHQQDG